MAIFFFACKKDKSCEGCINGNKPPTAVAGPNQIITLPTDSVSLDGNASSDPDGTISEWLWTKISGPASFIFNNSATAKTVVKNLIVGVYQFELKITDDKGLSATDTMQLVVDAVSPTNRPPIANAGSDTTIILPANTINLEGSRSTDSDNNITSYAWTKISGPSSFNIVNANAVQTQVTNLVENVYHFELKVTDAGGLFSKDTVQVTVNSIPITASCEPFNRPIVNAQLIPVGNLSIARYGMATATAGNKIFFAGGSSASGLSSRVDIYDLTTQIWSTSELSLPRTDVTAVTCANKIFFGGGSSASGASSRVDIYDITTQSWSTAELSEPRTFIVAATTGNKVFFAGGCLNQTFLWSSVSNKVDIYDIAANAWSTASLSETRIGFTATTAGNKIYFAGGWNLNPVVSSSASANIDIYDDATGTWSTSVLNTPKAFHGGIFKNGKIYWAAGETYIDEPWIGNNVYTCQVEIKDINTQTTSFANLSTPTEFVNRNGAFEKNDKIVFIYFYNQSSTWRLDIYDITANSWSIGVFSQVPNFYFDTMISSNNIIYIAGGSVNGVLSNQVWKLEF
jgi:hypothetical protein